jgi:pyocin large subunit-like protein
MYNIATPDGAETMTKGLGRAGWTALFGSAALLALAACDGGSASQPARDHSAAASSQSAPAAYADTRGEAQRGADGALASARPDPRREPVRLVNGRPMWAANKRHTAEENANYQFTRDGAAFGATSVDDFVAKAHAFVDAPKAGTQTLTRTNGDKLLYDPKRNIFAVVSREGAPRTMFKPDEGAAYWDQQKQRVAEQADNGGGRSSDDGGRYNSRRSAARSSADDQG